MSIFAHELELEAGALVSGATLSFVVGRDRDGKPRAKAIFALSATADGIEYPLHFCNATPPRARSGSEEAGEGDDRWSEHDARAWRDAPQSSWHGEASDPASDAPKWSQAASQDWEDHRDWSSPPAADVPARKSAVALCARRGTDAHSAPPDKPSKAELRFIRTLRLDPLLAGALVKLPCHDRADLMNQILAQRQACRATQRHWVLRHLAELSAGPASAQGAALRAHAVELAAGPRAFEDRGSRSSWDGEDS